MTLTGRGEKCNRTWENDHNPLSLVVLVPNGYQASTFLSIFIFLGSSVAGDFVRGCIFGVCQIVAMSRLHFPGSRNPGRGRYWHLRSVVGPDRVNEVVSFPPAELPILA